MKYKHIIGLDIGTNSLGWCLIKEFEDGRIGIVKTGVHIFPIGTIVDDKSNKEKTKNEQRRSYRGASRMRFRFKLRRNNLKNALDNLGMLPDYSKYYKAKGFGQSYELYKLRAEAINPENKIELREIGRIFMLLNKYRGFKSNAKNKKEDKETGIIKKGIEQLRYFMQKNNAQTIGQYFYMMHEKAKRLWDENKWHNFNEPLDERSFINDDEFVLFNSNGIRRHYGRPTSRSMYTDEFDMIWAAQKIYYPEIFTGSKKEYDEILSLPYSERIGELKEFKKTNYWHIKEYCIYYQRPLKSQKKYVSNCQFERGVFETKKYSVIENDIEKIKEKRIWKSKAKKACPKSHPLFQEFRIWQKLHQLNYSSLEEGIFQNPLKAEWLPVIAEYLMYNNDIHLVETKKTKAENKYWISKLLVEKGFLNLQNDYTFFIDKADEELDGDDKTESKITGNTTYARLKEALGEDDFNKIAIGDSTMHLKNGRNATLTELWHHLYIAKDGIFKEEDWLKCILTDKTKWNFTPEQADNLIAKGLVTDYGSYSSKVLNAILPFMRKGLNEYEALKAAGKGYINEDNTVGVKVQIKDKIAQLAYQELRNPVVERALSKAIKLVNSLLEKYKDEIDRESFEIRIESTRQFKKPRQERENERRKNAEKDKIRQEYADYLTKNKEKLGFTKDIYKYSPLVAKYELWLQMNMNEEDEVFINEFKSFSKITKQEDKLKHKLWLECGRRCPYTNDIINFTDCFSNEVEIEHIIPLSRRLDDSFNNKTLTYRITNARKGSMTPLEFLEKEGGNAVKAFKSRINGKKNYHSFSESKMKLLLAEAVPKEDFSSNQIGNTSYIVKYTRKKMQEVCKNVQFTNGSATAELRNKDWNLSNLLDKIRYEEDYQINIEEYFSNYYLIKKRFLEWYKKKYQTTDFKIDWKKLSENEDLELYQIETNDDLLYWDNGISAFNEFRNNSGKKDRSDHRHHAVDAFVIACCSPKIIKELSTYNAAKEAKNMDERDRIDKQFNYSELRESISTILVSHSEKQTLIKKSKNRIKTKEGIKEDITYAPQGSLHKETFYGKLKKPVNQGFEKKDVFISRCSLVSKNGSSEAYLFENSDGVEKVYEQNQQSILKNRFDFIKDKIDEKGNKLKPFSEKSMKEYPIFSYTPNDDKSKSKRGKTLPLIKSIRTKYKNERSIIELPNKKYADNDSNFLMIFFKEKDKSHFELLSLIKSVVNKRTGQKLFIDEIVKGKSHLPLNSECEWIKSGDLVILYENNDDKKAIDWSDNNILKNRLFTVKSLSSEEKYGIIGLLKHSKTGANLSYGKSAYKLSENKISFSNRNTQFNAIKVRLNILGEIEAKGEECF